MQKETIAQAAEQETDIDEEFIDTLIAISVVAKRLAKKLKIREQERQLNNGGNVNE